MISAVVVLSVAMAVGTAFFVPDPGQVLSEGVGLDLEIDGEVIGPGVECVQFRMASGEQISLQGSPVLQLQPGTPVRLTGVFLRMSTCMQGRTFRVSAAQDP